MLALRDVGVDYGEQAVLHRVSFEVRPGEAVALVGANGAGKSTLLAVCGGLLKASRGSVTLFGRDVWQAQTRDPRWLRSRVGIALQFPERSFFATTVRQELLFTPHRVRMKGAEEAARRSLARLGLPEAYWERSPFSLSGGEKRRLALAAAVAHEPALLLLDEPEAGLDQRGRRLVAALLREHAEGGGAALVATHDVEGATRWADRILRLAEGRVTDETRAEEWERALWPRWIRPLLADQGRAAAVQREVRSLGFLLPVPYGEPLDFLKALERQWGGNERGQDPAKGAGPP